MKKTIRLTESDLINIIKKVLKEQVVGGGLGLLRALPKSGGIKSAPKSGGRMKGPDTGGGDVNTCSLENIKSAIDTCVKSKSTYTSTRNSDYYMFNLYKAMKGMTFSHENTYKALQEIPDRDNFCRVAANFNYDKEGLYEWFYDEQTINYSKLWQIIKSKVGGNFVNDACQFQEFLNDPGSYYTSNKKIST